MTGMNVWDKPLRRDRAGMRALPALELGSRNRVEPAVRGDVRVSVSIGPAGELVALWCAESDVDVFMARTTSPGGATFPGTVSARPVAARITIDTPESRLVRELAEVWTAHPTVHPMPGGHVLLVGARAKWRAKGADRNAVLYDSAGHVVAQETVGDGIEHVMTTSGGRIWVGYCDEGVYGNYGWGSDGPAPLGSAGLVRYGPDLEADWKFPVHDEDHGGIDDCYALNVDGETAWICYYSDFPVARIQDGTVTYWHNDLTGVKALAVAGDTVALCGGYGPESDRVALARLEGDRVRITGQYRLILPGGEPLPQSARMIGRGRVLNVVTEDVWYRWDITHPV